MLKTPETPPSGQVADRILTMTAHSAHIVPAVSHHSSAPHASRGTLWRTSAVSPREEGRRQVRRRRRLVRRMRLVSAVTACVGLIAGGLLVAAPAMSAPSHELEITSLAFSGVDQAPGDGVCRTADGSCTLRAALEESNALNGAPGAVVIGVKPGLSGIIRPVMTRSTANWMQTSAVSTWDDGAFYRITAPVTLDLDNRVSIIPTSESTEACLLYTSPSPRDS